MCGGDVAEHLVEQPAQLCGLVQAEPHAARHLTGHAGCPLAQAPSLLGDADDDLALVISRAGPCAQALGLELLEQGGQRPGVETESLSEMADRRVNNPQEVVKLHQHVRVRVIDIDRARGRIQLSLKGIKN